MDSLRNLYNALPLNKEYDSERMRLDNEFRLWLILSIEKAFALFCRITIPGQYICAVSENTMTAHGFFIRPKIFSTLK
jgi:hypothetical protein